jgi:16S rRNA (guanine966-N2)-methyltransferase
VASRKAKPPRKRQQVRIIGGAWRGRRIEFPSLPALRPTPDRVRETLFSWLQGYIEGSRCLDLFAGSGALGFEAASRGAASVVMIDPDSQVIQHLRRQTEIFSASQIEIVMTDARYYLAMSSLPFDIVFLDPPFDSALLADACQLLEDYRALKTGARIYLETAVAASPPSLPASWALLKRVRAGQVGYQLAIKNG